jgi:Ca2+-binding RTX toxin-like protein
MSFAAVSIIAIGVGVGLQAKAASDAGKAANIAAKQKAKQVEFAAREREIDRRKELLLALSTQNAAAGAGGVRAYEGSQLNMLQSDFSAYDYDSTVDRGATDTNKAYLLFGGQVAKSQSLLEVAAIGAGAVSSIYSSGAGQALATKFNKET